jgi:hypothetical protein
LWRAAKEIYHEEVRYRAARKRSREDATSVGCTTDEPLPEGLPTTSSATGDDSNFDGDDGDDDRGGSDEPSEFHYVEDDDDDEQTMTIGRTGAQLEAKGVLVFIRSLDLGLPLYHAFHEFLAFQADARIPSILLSPYSQVYIKELWGINPINPATTEVELLWRGVLSAQSSTLALTSCLLMSSGTQLPPPSTLYLLPTTTNQQFDPTNSELSDGPLAACQTLFSHGTNYGALLYR